MPRKKDFWELADSTILGRTKKAELLKIARSEHQQAQALRAQIEAYTKQLETENQLIEQLRLERNQDDEIHRQVLENLLQVYYSKVDAHGTSQACPDCGAAVRKDLRVRIHHCPECGSIKPRDVAAAQVICTRGQRGIENACGVEVTGAEVTQSSGLVLKQEVFGATQRISNHTVRLVG
jgi:predicted RNA-binding Zn-ribbon protein involved in translation (DUF1610 family)